MGMNGQGSGKTARKARIVYVIVVVVIFVLMLFNMTGQNSMRFNVGKSEMFVMNGTEEWTLCNPGMPLRKGQQYSITLDFQDTPDGALVAVCSNNRGRLTNITAVNNNRTHISFTQNENDEFVQFAVYGGANLKSVNIKSNGLLNTDAIFGAIMFLLFAVMIYQMRFSDLGSRGEYKTAFLLVLLGLSASASSFMEYGSEHLHDIHFHLVRIDSIAQGLLNGQFPVRNYGFMNSGYGSATGILYPDLFLYIPAALKLLGVSTSCAYTSFLAIINIAAAFAAYYSVKTITKSSYAAWIAAVIYTFCSWRMENVMLRAAIGEALGMVFFPIIIAGMYHVLKGDKKKWYILAIGMTGMVNSHILSLFVAAVLCVVLCCVFFKDAVKKDALKAFSKAAAVTILLSVWFVVPFLDMLSEDLSMLSSESGFLDPSYQIIPSQLFNVFNLGMGGTDNVPIGGQMGKSLGVGITVMLFASAAYFIFRKNKKMENEGFMAVLFFAGLMTVWMATTYFPWTALYKITIIKKLVGSIQFSWRFLSVACSIICITGAAATAYFFKNSRYEKEVFVLLLSVSLLSAALYTGSYLSYTQTQQKNTEYNWSQEDYSYTNTNAAGYRANLYESDEFDVISAEKKGLEINMEVEPKVISEGTVRVPLSYYPGFSVRDANGNELEYVKSYNNVLAVVLPAGYSGAVEIRYTGNPAWRISDIISLLSIIGLAVYLIFRKKNKASGRKRKSAKAVETETY